MVFLTSSPFLFFIKIIDSITGDNESFIELSAIVNINFFINELDFGIGNFASLLMQMPNSSRSSSKWDWALSKPNLGGGHTGVFCPE